MEQIMIVFDKLNTLEDWAGTAVKFIEMCSHNSYVNMA